MTKVQITTDRIVDWDSFHNIFAETFGFPSFYGRNMDAWIDCMSYLDDPEAEMTKVNYKKGEYVVLELTEVRQFKDRCREQYEAIVECAAFVNFRNLEVGENPLLMLSFHF